MYPLIALAILLIGALVAGGLFLLAQGVTWSDGLEFLFASLSVGILALGWVAFVLAEFGMFSLSLLGGIWLAWTVGFGWLARGRLRQELLALRNVRREETIGLALWVIMAGLLFFRPHEFIVGGADAGVYVNLGASIARTGGILIHDPTLASLNPALYPALLRPLPASEAVPYYVLPGFYVPGVPATKIIPQFYHLHPVWQAIGYALGGLEVELLVTPLWALLGCLAVYLTVRQLWGWKAALLALVGLSVTALQVWFARYPTSEMLTQYLFWTGVWAFTAWSGQRQPRGMWAALAGTALGQVFLTRIDMYFLLAVPLLVALWLRWSGERHRETWWFFVPLGLLTIHSLIHGVWLSRPYFYNLVRYGRWFVGYYLTIPVILLGVGVGLLIALDVRPGWRRRLVNWIMARRSLWLKGIAALIGVLAVYAYFFRPRLGQVITYAYWYGGGHQVPLLDHENMVRLGWYLSPLGIVISVCGICWMIIRETRRRTAFLLGAGIFFSLFYLWRIQNNQHQIYTMRRYVPVVVPFFTIGGAYIVNWLHENVKGKSRWFGVGLALIWLLGLLASARGFVSQVDYEGLITQVARLNTVLEPHSVLIFNDSAPVGLGDFMGTPLRFLYGHDVFTLRDPEALSRAHFEQAIHRWRAEGREVYWIAVPEGYRWPGDESDLAFLGGHRLTSTVLEGTYEHKPQALINLVWEMSLSSAGIHPGEEE